MKQQTTWLHILAVILLTAVASCGSGSSEEDEPSESSNEAISGEKSEYQGESRITAFRRKTDEPVLVRREGDTVTLYNSSQQITGVQSGEKYIFQIDYVDERSNIPVTCETPSTFDNKIVFSCTVQNKYRCEMSLLKKEDGSFQPVEDTCTEVIKGLLPPPPPESITPSISLEGGKSITKSDSICEKIPHDPPLCPNIIEHPILGNEQEYLYSHSACGDSQIYPTQNQGAGSDGRDLLEVRRAEVYDEREGCFKFLFWKKCNGPWGNFHLAVVPYYNGWREIKNIYGFVRSMRDDGIANHTILQGPYKSDNKNCEWYDDEIVGPQFVNYQDRFVWDWDNFYIQVENRKVYSNAVLFAIWESDEGWWDDPVASGIIKREDTLKSPKMSEPNGRPFDIIFVTSHLPDGGDDFENLDTEFDDIERELADFDANFFGTDSDGDEDEYVEDDDEDDYEVEDDETDDEDDDADDSDDDDSNDEDDNDDE